MHKTRSKIVPNSSPHHDAKCLCVMMLDNILWEQMFPSVTSDAYSSNIVVQIVARFIRKCNLLPLGKPGTELLSSLKSEASVIQRERNPT